jgi:hypothetical protein
MGCCKSAAGAREVAPRFAGGSKCHGRGWKNTASSCSHGR